MAADETLTIAVPAIAARLDPLTDHGDGPGLLAATCDTLLTLRPDGALAPGLARAWRFSADARELALDLRADATFPDGEPVDADAVVASLARMTGEAHSQRRGELAPVVGIEATGRHSVSLRLDRAYAPLAFQLAGRAGMVVQDVAEDNDAPCAGPYRVAARLGDGALELARNEAHFARDDYAFARVRVVALAEGALRLARVRGGTVDLAGDIAPADAAEAAREGRVRIVAASDPGAAAILFNLSRGPRAAGALARETAARAAFAAALDLKALAEFAGAGYFAPFAQPPTMPPRAGLAVELTVPGDGESPALAGEIARQAAAAGVWVRVRVREPARAALDVQNGDFEAALVRLPSRVDPDLRLWQAFHCRGAANDAGYCDAQTDAALDAARAETDPARREALYARAQARIASLLPALFLPARARIVAAGPRAAGFVPFPDGGWRLSGVKP